MPGGRKRLSLIQMSLKLSREIASDRVSSSVFSSEGLLNGTSSDPATKSIPSLGKSARLSEQLYVKSNWKILPSQGSSFGALAEPFRANSENGEELSR